MRNLFTFLWRHNFFLLFILLEAIAITLTIQNNYYQKTSFINSTNTFMANILNINRNIYEYFSLKKNNNTLSEENAKLHSKSIKNFINLNNKIFYITDTLYRQKYQYISAKIISNSVNKRNNYITLNKGRDNGIKNGMAVISPNGIAGIVKDVSKHFSSVISVLHKQAKISAKIKKNGYTGTILWNGINYKIGTLKDIPTHVKLSTGDTVITSGYSSIFPEGILIGTIIDYKKEQGSNFYTIYLKFSEDYNKISYVYVINNLLKEEQKKLETISQND